MKHYNIVKTPTSKPNWADIPSLNIDIFPWYESGLKQATSVQLAHTNDALLIRIDADDRYSFAQQTKLNHMLICQDSCVEFFFSPSGELGSSYINLEVNCCGTLHLAYGPGREFRTFIPLELAGLVERTSSIKSPVKTEQADDNSWSVDITLPFKVIEKFTQSKVDRNKWFGNFYRCGGRNEPQYASWNNIDVAEPDYHRPETFGELSFNQE